MRNLCVIAAVVSCGLGSCCVTAYGQAVTVQQPVVGVFSVDTVVSVPDRGRMTLGGVSSAGSQWSSYGFGPFRQSSFGQFTNASAADVGVYIFDFEAMDQALLSQPTARSASSKPVVPHAEDSWLFAQRNRPGAARAVNPPTGESVNVARTSARVTQGPPESSDAAEQAAFYLERGRSAEAKGKTGAAALCYRMAAKYGSRDAADRLATLAAK